MDSTIELEEPDEARPAKRMRFDAPLGITEDVQEETIDDGDWDDIYETAPTPKKEVSPLGGVPTKAELEVPEHDQNGQGKAQNASTAEVLDEGDELVAQGEPAASMDDPSAKMLEETTEIEVGAAHKHENDRENDSPMNGTVDEGAEQLKGDGNREVEQEQMEGTDHTTLNGSGPITDGKTNGDVSEALPEPAQDPEFFAVAAVQKCNEEAEWQFDSSDADSSSDSDSESGADDASDGSGTGSEDGYEMLDPATAAKILMSGDGDDDEGEKGKNRTGDHQPRTANEVKEELVPKPDVIVTEDMQITYLGNIDRTIDNVALVKAATPGEFQVLEYGSVLCNEKREVIGSVAETLGRVQEPMYSVAFTNAKEMEDLGLGYGAKVFYVDSHSTFVFTQPLKNMKGTDASNIHDEEVGEDELEFSDDEAEAEYKRQKKLAKRGGRGGLSRSAFNEQRTERSFGVPGHDSGQTFVNGGDVPQQSYGGGLSYDDGDVQEEFYSPLKRPDNLSQLMAGGGPPPRPPQGHFDRGRGRGRGDRGRGRGDRGRGRGGSDRRTQRGGHGDHSHRESNRGGAHSQQNAYRGNAHSFPDRHNSDRVDEPRRPSVTAKPNAQRSSPLPPQQQSYQQYQQHQPQAHNQQSYQFNGYTFQRGSPIPAPQPHVLPVGHYNQPQSAQSPGAAFPAGAYVNPAFFQTQQQQTQWMQGQSQQQPAYGWPNQQQTQQYQYAQPGQGQLSPQQQSNLADILKQFGGQQQR